MKKYNTSLSILLEEQPKLVNEGFSRLAKRVSFIEQKGARCKLDFPDEYRQLMLQFLTGVKKEYGSPTRSAPESGLDYTKLKVDKDKKRQEELEAEAGGKKPGAIVGGVQSIMKYTETFFGAYATETLSSENFQTVEELFNMFVMDSVPYVYCQALNRLMRMFLPVIKIYLEDVKQKEDKTVDVIDFEMPDTDIIYREYGRKVLLPNVYRDAVAYSNKIKSFNISFLKKSENSNMMYAILFFKNFSKEILLNDKFDINKLKEDIQDFEDIYNLSIFKGAKPLDTVDAYEQFEEAVEFDNNKLNSESDALKKEFEAFDEKNDNDKASAIQVKNALKEKYTSYLITIIEKIFYDSVFVNNIPLDCKNELDQFLSFLKTKMK